MAAAFVRLETSPEGIVFIIQWEGERLRRYLCAAGKPTIGVGHLILPSENIPDEITRDESRRLLKRDLQRFESAVLRLVKVPMTQAQFDALVSFSFNLGAGALKASTLLRLMNAGDYSGAAREFPKWNKAGGRVIRGLTLRRLAEQAVYQGGQPKEIAPVTPPAFKVVPASRPKPPEPVTDSRPAPAQQQAQATAAGLGYLMVRFWNWMRSSA